LCKKNFINVARKQHSTARMLVFRGAYGIMNST
jgi:hypothetical protein